MISSIILAIAILVADPHSIASRSAVAVPADHDSAAVQSVVEGFHAALAVGDSLGALRLLTDDVLVLEAGGIESRSDYRSHHLPADIEFSRAVKSTRRTLRVTVAGNTAWVASSSTTRGQFKDRAIDSIGAELVILRRTRDGWKIAAIHWSSRRR